MKKLPPLTSKLDLKDLKEIEKAVEEGKKLPALDLIILTYELLRLLIHKPKAKGYTYTLVKLMRTLRKAKGKVTKQELVRHILDKKVAEILFLWYHTVRTTKDALPIFPLAALVNIFSDGRAKIRDSRGKPVLLPQLIDLLYEKRPKSIYWETWDAVCQKYPFLDILEHYPYFRLAPNEHLLHVDLTEVKAKGKPAPLARIVQALEDFHRRPIDALQREVLLEQFSDRGVDATRMPDSLRRKLLPDLLQKMAEDDPSFLVRITAPGLSRLLKSVDLKFRVRLVLPEHPRAAERDLSTLGVKCTVFRTYREDNGDVYVVARTNHIPERFFGNELFLNIGIFTAAYLKSLDYEADRYTVVRYLDVPQAEKELETFLKLADSIFPAAPQALWERNFRLFEVVWDKLQPIKDRPATLRDLVNTVASDPDAHRPPKKRYADEIMKAYLARTVGWPVKLGQVRRKLRRHHVNRVLLCLRWFGYDITEFVKDQPNVALLLSEDEAAKVMTDRSYPRRTRSLATVRWFYLTKGAKDAPITAEDLGFDDRHLPSIDDKTRTYVAAYAVALGYLGKELYVPQYTDVPERVARYFLEHGLAKGYQRLNQHECVLELVPLDTERLIVPPTTMEKLNALLAKLFPSAPFLARVDTLDPKEILPAIALQLPKADTETKRKRVPDSVKWLYEMGYTRLYSEDYLALAKVQRWLRDVANSLKHQVAAESKEAAVIVTIDPRRLLNCNFFDTIQSCQCLFESSADRLATPRNAVAMLRGDVPKGTQPFMVFIFNDRRRAAARFTGCFSVKTGKPFHASRVYTSYNAGTYYLILSRLHEALEPVPIGHNCGLYIDED